MEKDQYSPILFHSTSRQRHKNIHNSSSDDDLSSNEVSLRSTTRLAKQIPECAEIIYGSTDSIKKLFDSVSQDNSSTAQLTGYRLRQKRSRPESPTTDSSSESQSSSVMTLENKHAKQSRQEIGNSSTSNGSVGIVIEPFHPDGTFNINDGTSIVGTNPTSHSGQQSQMEYSLEPNRAQDSMASSAKTASASWPSPPARKRTLIEGALKDALEKHFYMEHKPSLATITSLAESLRMKTEVVRVWFANRRHKEKCSKPIAKSKRPGRKARAARRAPVPCKSVSETSETIQELIDSVTESNSSAVQLSELNRIDLESLGPPPLLDVESQVPLLNTENEVPLVVEPLDTNPASDETEELPEMECSLETFVQELIVPSDTNVFNYPQAGNGGSFKNGRPWGPLSRRQPVEEDTFDISVTFSDLIKDVRFAEKQIKRSNKIGNQKGIDVYDVPVTKSIEPTSTFQRMVFGEIDAHAEHRTVLVLGANSSSQAKFINGIINFIFDVDLNDSYRFQLVEEEPASQSNCIKVYDIHHSCGFRVTYSLTIITMPTYDANSDDTQLFRDQNIAKMFLEFFEDEGGVQELDMICHIEADGNQHYLLSIFGNDVKDNNNCWMPTDYFGDNCKWQDGIQRFFVALAKKETKSLSLTRQVLEERKHMEAMLDGLQSLIETVSVKMEEINKTKKMITFCQAQIPPTAEVEETFPVELTQKVELPPGQYMINCNQCFVTCHNSFVKKDKVYSPDVTEAIVLESCSVCPGKCSWSMHSNQPYRWVYVKKEPTDFTNPANQRYEAEMKWKKIRSNGQELVKVLQNDLVENGTIMLEHFQSTWRCIQQLNKIALHGNSFLTQKVFDVLYDAEQQLKELGFEDGLESLKM
ncbi:uncharacterized protein LOC124349460 isoform X2 [Daphnia pulicaria]|uniref:uncharacterized protein LOC124349460 isoform X2 n=1 Tax=Daphnia pulicaria TaxID=35523 RepID=UPI001EEB42FC|nr:uncharacterized protein LOC124349460 isoform X2 [Daphnia pulicaria]